jgi:hypothetical protein
MSLEKISIGMDAHISKAPDSSEKYSCTAVNGSHATKIVLKVVMTMIDSDRYSSFSHLPQPVKRYAMWFVKKPITIIRLK